MADSAGIGLLPEGLPWRSAALRVDFVSDVTCPWCAIGLQGLEQAIARVGRPVELHLQPFELNPDMPPQGEPVAAYAARKYGASAEQMAARQRLIRQRGAEAGLALAERTHVYNTFDAHRLLHWASLQGRGLDLKRALLAAYHERGENPASPEVLVRAAAVAGLDTVAAAALLDSDAHVQTVRDTVRQWQRRGIDSVPSVVIDGQHLIQGARSVEDFERALRKVAEAAQPVG